MNPDIELEAWRREWQTDAAVPRDVRQRVARQSRWMRVMIAADILVTVVIGGGVLALAVRAPRLEMMLLATGTWLFIAAAWTFRLFANRGLWQPSAMQTEAFVDLLIRRCRAKLAASIFGAVLYVCEIAFCLGWIYRYRSLSVALPICLFFVTLAFFGFLMWYRRKQRAELAWLLKLR